MKTLPMDYIGNQHPLPRLHKPTDQSLPMSIDDQTNISIGICCHRSMIIMKSFKNGNGRYKIKKWWSKITKQNLKQKQISMTHLIHLNNFLEIRILKNIELIVCDVWYHSIATDLVFQMNEHTRQVILYFPGVVLTYDESHSITEAISMIALYYSLFSYIRLPEMFSPSVK